VATIRGKPPGRIDHASIVHPHTPNNAPINVVALAGSFAIHVLALTSFTSIASCTSSSDETAAAGPLGVDDERRPSTASGDCSVGSSDSPASPPPATSRPATAASQPESAIAHVPDVDAPVATSGNACVDAAGCFRVVTGTRDLPSPGCSADDATKPALAACIESRADEVVARFFLTKIPSAPFTMAHDLRLVVMPEGTMPWCSEATPPFLVKVFSPDRQPGPYEHEIEMSLSGYSGDWPPGSTKQFVVELEEAGFVSYRASGGVVIERLLGCSP
jgi:hypothetical protein